MKRSPLHDVHVSLKARLVDFAGYEMPIQYRTGINEEHNAVRNACGIFDVSHMGQLRVTGEDSVGFLRFAALNDVGRLKVGRAHYSMLPNDEGGIVDDIYVNRDGEHDFLLVPNAANTGAVLAHLRQLAVGYPDVSISDETDLWAVMAVQGPEAIGLIERLAGEDLSTVRKNASERTTIGGHQVSLTRTGYTGEDGFEVYCAPDVATAIWELITAAGAVPCGLGARDTLRLEAGFPLYGNDIDGTTNPLCTSMAWLVKDKDFHGRDRLWGADCPRRLVGLELRERGIPRSGYSILSEGSKVGVITSGTISPFTRKAIALGWVDSAFTESGTEVAVEIRGQPVIAVITEPPFFSKQVD